MTSQSELSLQYYEMLLPEQWSAFERRIAADRETAVVRAPVRLGMPREYHVYIRGAYVKTCGTLEEAVQRARQDQLWTAIGPR